MSPSWKKLRNWYRENVDVDWAASAEPSEQDWLDYREAANAGFVPLKVRQGVEKLAQEMSKCEIGSSRYNYWAFYFWHDINRWSARWRASKSNYNKSDP